MKGTKTFIPRWLYWRHRECCTVGLWGWTVK